jgi:hypothetical protein
MILFLGIGLLILLNAGVFGAGLYTGRHRSIDYKKRWLEANRTIQLLQESSEPEPGDWKLFYKLLDSQYKNGRPAGLCEYPFVRRGRQTKRIGSSVESDKDRQKYVNMVKRMNRGELEV